LTAVRAGLVASEIYFGEASLELISKKRKTEKRMRVVICGGGVIGACTGYFLARRGVEVLIVERTGVANAASGRAGGFLAYDWCAGIPLDALARRSFRPNFLARSREIGAIDA